MSTQRLKDSKTSEDKYIILTTAEPDLLENVCTKSIENTVCNGNINNIIDFIPIAPVK